MSPSDVPDQFDADLEAEHTSGGHGDESLPAADDKEVRAELSDFDGDDLKGLSVLTVGTRLDQGSTYVDLADTSRRPFRAIGGEEAGEENRYVAKRDTDYELWDRLVGRGTTAETHHPGTE